MNRDEFISELRAHLVGKVDNNELNRQIDYYSTYIQNEINNGKSESEVLDMLGNPRLIAKTIVHTYGLKEDPIRKQYRNEQEYSEETYETEGQSDKFATKMQRVFTIVAIVLVIMAVISLVFSLIGFFLPIVAVVVIIMIIVRMLSGR